MRNDILKLIESIQNLNTKETLEELIEEITKETPTKEVAHNPTENSTDLIDLLFALTIDDDTETWTKNNGAITVKKENGTIRLLFDRPIAELIINYKNSEKEEIEFTKVKEEKKSPTIVSLIGCSSSGKDAVLKEMLKQNPKTLKGLVSHTTRPMRKGETEGKEYHFISKKEFEDKLGAGEFVEYRTYNIANGETWYYGLSQTEIDINSDNIYVGIFDINGYWSLVDEYGKENVFPVYIDCDVVIRLERALSREGITPGTEKYREVLRRLYADSEEIEQYKNEFDTIFYNGNCLQEEFEDKVSCLVNSIIEYHECK